MSQHEKASLLRELPSIDELLATEPLVSISERAGHTTALRIARSSIETLRGEILTDSLHQNREQLVAALTKIAGEIFDRERSARVRRVINATGVVIHTNLGRSVLSEPARQAAADNLAHLVARALPLARVLDDAPHLV